MRYPQRIWRLGKIAFLALSGWLAAHGTVLAQAAKTAKKNEEGGGSYVLSYFLVILGIAFGLLFVCRSSSRHDRARDEAKGAAKH